MFYVLKVLEVVESVRYVLKLLEVVFYVLEVLERYVRMMG